MGKLVFPALAHFSVLNFFSKHFRHKERNQFGFFRRKVTSRMCISTTRDPSLNGKYSEQLFICHVVLCIQKLRSLCHTCSAVLVFQSCKTAFFVSLAHLNNSCESKKELRYRSLVKCLSLNILSLKQKGHGCLYVEQKIFSRINDSPNYNF